jgi:hypothetical protein
MLTLQHAKFFSVRWRRVAVFSNATSGYTALRNHRLTGAAALFIPLT